MSSTDDRIVRMQFDNKTFMKNASDTSKALSDVDKSVADAGKSRGLLDLSSQMETVSVTASKMSIATTAALATIASKATTVGLGLIKSLTFDPIKSGFSEYEALLTKQNTIMNATGLSARTVKKYLNELNTYSDQTIYSFGNMSESIMKFVNAGVPLKEAIGTVKGIANAAAFAGASTNDANRAMFAFGQSISNGFLTLGDFNQIESANMATVQFKDTLLEAAAAAGTLTKEGDMYVTKSGERINATKGFQYSLQEQWATTQVLNDALGKYNDQSTELGRKAAESATEVRTFTAFIDTLKESIGSGWSQIFTSLFGNLNQATSFWTGFSEAVGGAVSSFFSFISVALKTWRQMGGFEKTLQGFKNILSPFAALLGAIGDAWNQAFPSSNKGAGKALYGLSAGFELLTRPLTWLAEGIPAITPVLATLFKVIAAGGNAIGDVIGYIVDFVNGAKALSDINAPDSSGFLGFVQDIVRVLDAAVDKAGQLIDKAGGLTGVFSGISMPSLPSMPSMPSADTSGAAEGASSAASAAEGAVSSMGRAMESLRSIAVKMGEGFHWLWDQAVSFFKQASPEDFVKAFNTAIFATMAYEVIRFVHTMRKGLGSLADLIPAASRFIDDLGGTLGDFATAAKRQAMAKIILNVAIALAVLTASLWVLSKIPAKQLLQALGAMGVLAVILNKSLGAFGDVVDKLAKKGTIGKTLALSVAMIALAGSMVLMSTAMFIMNRVKWDSILKGLGTMIVMMKTLEQLGNLGEQAAKNLVGAAFAITAVSVAMVIMAGALLLFQMVKWESIGKAGATLGGLALAVGLLALIPYQGIAKVGAALLGASAGMMLMANALILFGLVKWEDIGKAAVVLLLLTVSLAVLMAVGGPASVAAMLGLAGAMVLLALACIMFNHVDWESIGKAAVVLTLLLAALAVGAVILTAFLYAIAPVSPVLIILAAGFALLGIGLLAFAAAMTIAMGLAAAGTAAFATLAVGAAVAVGVFLQTLAMQAPVMKDSVLAILQSFLDGIVESVPMIIQAFKDIWKIIMKEMGGEGKKKSFGQIAEEYLDKFIDFARRNIPKVQKLFVDMVLSLLRALNARADQFAKIGTEFIVNLIQGVSSRQQAIIDAAVDMVIKMAEGFRKNVKKLTDAGIDLIAGFLHDLADSIRSGGSKIGSGITDVIDAFRDVGVDMIQGLIEGASSVDIGGFISNLASQLPGWAKKVLDIHSPSRVFMEIGKFVALGLAKGIQDHAAAAITAVGSMMKGSIAMADDYMNQMLQKMDQKAIAARATALGLARAANAAAKSANRTKDKGDDKAANKIKAAAKKADKEADKEEAAARAERQAIARREQWEKADAAQRAEIRSKQAQSQLAGAKAAEREAAAARIQARALDEQAKKAGTDKERKALQAMADKLRKQAKEQAEKANDLVKKSRGNAADAIKYQQIAGEQAAKAFEEQFEAEAQADADAAAFEKLSDSEKAAKRREQAEELQRKADANLEKAKKLAYTDLEKANELAQLALAQAEESRNLLEEANSFGGGTGQVLSLDMTDSAIAAYNNYADLYDSAYAAAAAGQKIEFNQYNTSPEYLSDADIYRQTNNQLTFAEDKLAGAA